MALTFPTPRRLGYAMSRTGIVAAAIVLFWAVIAIIGSFFRGPGFNFTLPWIDGVFFEL